MSDNDRRPYHSNQHYQKKQRRGYGQGYGGPNRDVRPGFDNPNGRGPGPPPPQQPRYHQDGSRGYGGHPEGGSFAGSNWNAHGRVKQQQHPYGPSAGTGNDTYRQYKREHPNDREEKPSRILPGGMKKEEPTDANTHPDADATMKLETSDETSHPPKKEDLVQDLQNWKQEWGKMDAKMRMKKLLHDDMDFLPEVLELPSDAKVAKALLETKAKLKLEIAKEENQQQNTYHQNHYDSDDSYDPLGELEQLHSAGKKRSTIELYQPFLEALPQCTALNYGFHVVRIYSYHSDEWCCCPCGKKLSAWRKMIQCASDDEMRDLGEEQCDDKKYSPKGLLDHLSSKRNHGFFHWIVETYLRTLYKDYFKPGLDHKALYNINDANWRKAETMEMLDVNRKIVELQKERVEYRKREAEREKYIQVLQENNMELANQLEQQDEIKKQLASLLQIHEHPSEVDISPEKLEKCWKCRDDAFDLHRNLFRLKTGNINDDPKIESDEEQRSFNITKRFEKWQADPKNEFFCEIDDLTCLKFLSQMNIKYETVGKIKEDDDDGAIDDGGPSRVFLSRVWEQLEKLSVKSHKDTFVSLFRKNPGGLLVPQEDSMLSYQVLRNMDPKKLDIENLKAIVQPYYRAVGRLLLHCLAVDNYFKIEDEDTEFLERKHRYMIGGHVLPSIYRNYLLRGVDPMDKDYALSNVLRDFVAIKDATNTNSSSMTAILQGLGLDELELEAMKDNPKLMHQTFREKVKNSVIDEVNIALEALQQGLTLDGNVNIRMAFQFPPLEAVNIMFFSPPHGATVNELISVLECTDYSTKRRLAETQKKIFYRDSVNENESGFLKEILYELEKKQKSIAGDFLEFATGSRYLPQRPTECKFKIVIEFHDEMESNALPMAHTCVKVVKFPSSAYDGKKDILHEKLVHALANKKYFMMG